MRLNKQTIAGFSLLILVASLYRVIPGRPWGFAPQIAMALFGGSVIRDKKLSFLLPLLSMFISDLAYEMLFRKELSTISGFYPGQAFNYLLFAAITLIGFYVKENKVSSIVVGSFTGTTFYFIVSNFAVWIGGGLNLLNQPYPKNLAGLGSCYAAGIPFYYTSLIATFVFGVVLFGGYYLVKKYSFQRNKAIA